MEDIFIGLRRRMLACSLISLESPPPCFSEALELTGGASGDQDHRSRPSLQG